MLKLDCPNCNAQLEIDEGFRGGVCRCFSCGTLMTVPDDPGSGGAEPLFQQKSSRPAGRKTTRPTTQPRPGGTSRMDPVDTDAESEEDTQSITFRTASGKEVKLSSDEVEAMPVATKRQVVRWTTRIGVVLFMASMTGVVLWGAMQVFSKAQQQDELPTAQEARQGIIHVEENPYLDKRANFLGLDVGERTVFLIDSSLSMQRYLAWIKTAVALSAARLNANQSFQVVFANESGPKSFPDQMTPGMALDPELVSEKLQDVLAQGTVSLEAALDRALQTNPDQITLVASELPPAQRQTIRRKLSGVRLMVVLIDNIDIDEDSELAKMAQATGGKLITLHGTRIENWYEAYLDKKASEGENP